MKIKVCGIKYIDNALEIANLQPDYMGFIFYEKSPRYVFDGDLNGKMNMLPEEIKKVGVFVNEELERVNELIESFNLDAVQLHGSESVHYCNSLKDNNIEILKAFGVDDQFDFSEAEPFVDIVDYFLFDTKVKGKSGGTGQKFNWNIFDDYRLKTPFILSGGLGSDDYLQVKQLDHPMFKGIDLNSKFEISAGLKNVEKLDQFINHFR